MHCYLGEKVVREKEYLSAMVRARGVYPRENMYGSIAETSDMEAPKAADFPRVKKLAAKVNAHLVNDLSKYGLITISHDMVPAHTNLIHASIQRGQTSIPSLQIALWTGNVVSVD